MGNSIAVFSLFILLAILLFITVNIYCGTCSGGTGDPNNPSLIATPANVAVVKNVTAANEGAKRVGTTANGSGMLGDFCDDLAFGAWLTEHDSNGGGPKNAHPGTFNSGTESWTWIKYEFDRVYPLGELWVWNYNCWGDSTSCGLKNVVVEYTADGKNWTKLGDYVFAEAPGASPYAHNTTVDFGGARAKAVVITTKGGRGVGNWGGENYGLSQVRFNFNPGSNELWQLLETGRFGRAIRFKPIEPGYWVQASFLPQYVQLPITVECWVKLDSKAKVNQLIAAGVKESVNHWRIFSEAGSGRFACYLPGKSPSSISSDKDIADGQWHYLAMILEDTRVRLSVDGVNKSDVNLVTVSMDPNNNGQFYFGAYPQENISCAGLLDEARISKGICDVNKIPRLSFRPDASTIGLWNFDQYEQNGQTVKFDDASDLNNAGRIMPSEAASNLPSISAVHIPPPAKLAVELKRGVSIDRQYMGNNPPEKPNFEQSDIKLIKSMGFDHVKIIVNPEPHKSGDGIKLSSMSYLDEIVGMVINEGLTVVVCIHPMSTFKIKVLSDPKEFSDMLGFYEKFTAYLTAKWSPKQLVFQLMTEPHGNILDWNILQPQMWAAVRRGMPKHTLILSGDQLAIIDGLLQTKPVDDDNVIYCFGFYEPFAFTFQGGVWWGKWFPKLADVPYPSSPEIIEAALPDILSKIPKEMQPLAKKQLESYGKERWDRDRLAARIQRVMNWNDFYGGGLKFWITEWGVYYKTTNPDHRYAFIRDARELFEANGIGWAYWSYNEDQTILNPKNRAPRGKEYWDYGSGTAEKIDKKMLKALGLLDDKDAERQ